MVQAADRRQDGATSTPPSLPAPSWRRDFSGKDEIIRVPPGTFPLDRQETRPEGRAEGRPAAVMLLAPILGLGIWAVILALIF